MENLFSALQLDKHFKRQATLLKHMGSVPYLVRTKELTDVTGLSVPTLRNEINELNDSLKDHVSIVLQKNGGYEMVFLSDHSIDQLINILAQKTAVFQIINSIFYEKRWTLQRALKELALSRTTFMRLIHHMNEVLKLFHV